MSEPTGGSNQPPDPDSERSPRRDAAQEPGAARDEVQDQIPETVFSDPTAPVWADPTTPIPSLPPVPPTPPGAASSTYGEQPAASPYGQQQTPDVSSSNPYAQPPPPQPDQYGASGQQYADYGQQPQPQPGQYATYGQQPPAQPGQYAAYGQQPYATGAQPEANASGIVLTILSLIVMLGTCFTIGIPSLVFGIMALTSNSTDPVGSRKKAKTGWIVFAINAAAVVLIVIAGFALLAANSSSSSSTSSY